jgi:hypothetical protein
VERIQQLHHSCLAISVNKGFNEHTRDFFSTIQESDAYGETKMSSMANVANGGKVFY